MRVIILSYLYEYNIFISIIFNDLYESIIYVYTVQYKHDIFIFINPHKYMPHSYYYL